MSVYLVCILKIILLCMCWESIFHISNCNSTLIQSETKIKIITKPLSPMIIVLAWTFKSCLWLINYFNYTPQLISIVSYTTTFPSNTFKYSSSSWIFFFSPFLPFISPKRNSFLSSKSSRICLCNFTYSSLAMSFI